MPSCSVFAVFQYDTQFGEPVADPVRKSPLLLLPEQISQLHDKVDEWGRLVLARLADIESKAEYAR